MGAEILAHSACVEEVLDVLEAHISLTVAARTSQWLFVHAGVVEWRGRAIVLPGRSFSGKTTLVAALVQIYSLEYLHDEPKAGLGRYYAYQSLFAFSMMGLVLAPNLLQLFICWELVGLCSYLLIGFWYQKPEAARAALKAFWTTKAGDVGLLIGIVLLWRLTGTFDFAELERRGASAVILSGGPSSVYDADAPKPDPAIWSGRLPVLGICYGAQLMANELGRIFQIKATRLGPFPGRIRDVGVVVDLAPHDLDVMRYLLGSNPVRLYAEAEQRIHTDHEDLFNGLMKFANGVIGMLDINWLTPTKLRTLTVTGERGMYVADYIAQDLVFYANPDASHTWEDRGADDAGPPISSVAEGEMVRRYVRKREPLAVELAEFAAAVRSGGPPPVDPRDAMVAVLLARKLVEAASAGRVVAGAELEEVLA